MTHNEIKDFYGYPRTLLLRNNNTLADTIVSTRVLFLTSEQGILSRAAALSPRFARCHVSENSPPDCFLPHTSYAPSLFESLASDTDEKQKVAPYGTTFYFWRRARDSNPRTAINGYTISKCLPDSPETLIK